MPWDRIRVLMSVTESSCPELVVSYGLSSHLSRASTHLSQLEMLNRVVVVLVYLSCLWQDLDNQNRIIP